MSRSADQRFEEAYRSAGLGDPSPNGQDQETESEAKQDRRNQADRLIGYALEDADALFVDQHGAAHALVRGESVPLTSRCYPWLRLLMWEQEGRAVSGDYLRPLPVP